MPSPASCTHAPPAPLPSVAFRCPPAPRSRAYRTPAHCHPLPGRPPCRAPPSSPCAAVRIVPTVRRHPRHPPHLSPRVASAPGPWLARIAPHASLFRRMREKGPLPGSIRPKCMLFEIKTATSSPYASIPGRNRAIQDAWRMNLAAKGPLSRRGTRNHAWREDAASAARPFRGSSLRSGRMGFAPCGSGMRHAAWPNGLCALRRGPGLLAACAPPLPSRLCSPWPAAPPPAFIAAVLYASRFAARIAPTHAAIRRAAHCGRGELSIGLFLPPSCCPRRYISLPARRTHPASRADPPRPGNKRNNTSNSMRA